MRIQIKNQTPKPLPLITKDEAQKLANQYRENPSVVVCKHCGGIHPHHECWRVKRVVFKGNDVVEAEYWQEWDKIDTLWIDQILDIAAQ